MGTFMRSFRQVISKVDPSIGMVMRNDPIDKGIASALGSGPKKPPIIPNTPTQDTAANAILQQQDALNRRKGVLGTIFGGNYSAAAPTVATKSLLGQ